jgi:hypothetical protein
MPYFVFDDHAPEGSTGYVGLNCFAGDAVLLLHVLQKMNIVKAGFTSEEELVALLATLPRYEELCLRLPSTT